MAALPIMARTQGSTMNSPFGRSPTAAAQSLSQTCQLMGHAIRRHIRGELAPRYPVNSNLSYVNAQDGKKGEELR